MPDFHFGRNAMRVEKRALCLALGLILVAGAAERSLAADAPDTFYKGKQITIIVAGGGIGGAYDAYGRLLAKHWSDHIPGNPTIVVQAQPAASGIPSTSFLSDTAPRDGTVLAVSLSSIPTAPLTAPDTAHFDVNKLSWIGSATKDPFVGYVWHTAPAQTYEDLKKTEVTMGGNYVGGAGVDMVIISNNLFGTKMKIVTGYSGSAETKLALERGEVQGTFANGWTDLQTTKPDWLRDKKVRILIQHGFTRHPSLPDVPLLVDQAKNDADRQLLVFMLARQEFAKPFFGPPGLPPARLEMLRRTFDATMKDPNFLADAQKTNLAIDGPMTGEELAKTVSSVAATPESVVKRVEKMLADFGAQR